jgi:thiamine biosynthesis lipoprotein
MAEIRRLEGVFSLYQPTSALRCLNRNAILAEPPFELLDCLTLAGSVHSASDGCFDPTVQPLWQAYALATERGQALSAAEHAAAKALTGWSGVTLAPEAITLHPGMALTLNGIAQGYIADRVAALLATHGLTHAMIDTGELRAMPEGLWPVQLPDREIALEGRALATSAPLGMTFGSDGRSSHIIDPALGLPVQARWKSVSISAPLAAVADAISTAACLMENRDRIVALCNRMPGANLESAVTL